MLQGQAKKDYQREYMKKQRANKVVRPKVLDPVLPMVTVRPTKPDVKTSPKRPVKGLANYYT